jgi:hypothetical protein
MEEFNNKELKYIFSDSKEVENLGIIKPKIIRDINIIDASYRLISKFDALKIPLFTMPSLNFKTFYINNDGYFNIK